MQKALSELGLDSPQSGECIDGQFQVNSYTTNRQHDAAIALDSHGNFVFVWSSLGSEGGRANFACKPRWYSGGPVQVWQESNIPADNP